MSTPDKSQPPQEMGFLDSVKAGITLLLDPPRLSPEQIQAITQSREEAIARVNSVTEGMSAEEKALIIPADEGFIDKTIRRCMEEPFVPLGAAATTYFLVKGFKSFRAGDPASAQMNMRFRVAAQALTIVAMAGTALVSMPEKIKKDMEQHEADMKALANYEAKKAHEGKKNE